MTDPTGLSQKLIATFQVTHTYKGKEYEFLQLVRMKDPNFSGEWVDAYLYRDEHGNLFVRELNDFVRKFTKELDE